MSMSPLALAAMDPSDPAYRAGYVTGRILFLIIVVAILYALIRRLRK